MTDHLSRRTFLQFTSLSLIGLQTGWSIHTEAPMIARALTVVPVHRQPNTSASVIETLWPNSVYQVVPSGNWLQVRDGFAPVTAFQPMMPPDPKALITTLPTWVEVTAPYVAIRKYCAGDAPLVEQVGHGGVLFADQALDDWLHVDAGWIQAQHVQSANPVAVHHPATRPLLTIRNGHLEAYEDEQLVLRSICCHPDHLPHIDDIISQTPGTANDQHLGVPWAINGKWVTIHGVYWHNDFRGATDTIELPVIAARTLYSWVLGAGQQIQFRT